MQVVTSAGRSEAEFQVDMSVQESLERLQAGLASQNRFKLVELDTREVQLLGRPNWAAWGARVTLCLVAVGESASLVRGRWEPALPTTALTWGQGARDLQAIERLLRSQLDRSPA